MNVCLYKYLQWLLLLLLILLLLILLLCTRLIPIFILFDSLEYVSALRGLHMSLNNSNVNACQIPAQYQDKEYLLYMNSRVN